MTRVHGHHHHHKHHHVTPSAGQGTRAFAIAFTLNLGFAMIELIGGYLTHSLAITADAIHDFGDALSIGLAWGLEYLSRRASDDSFHFGYRRFSLIAALASGGVIAVGSLLIAFKAVSSLSHYLTSGLPLPQPLAFGMIGLAFLGIAVNGAAAWNLRTGRSPSERLLNWHLIEDLLGWVIVLVGAAIMQLTGWSWIDPVMALALAVFVSWNVFSHLKETVYLLLQGRPSTFSSAAFVDEVLAIDGIGAVDRLRVWSLDGERTVMSTRLHLHNSSDKDEIEKLKGRVRHIAEHHFGAADVTIETCLLADSCGDRQDDRGADEPESSERGPNNR